MSAFNELNIVDVIQSEHNYWQKPFDVAEYSTAEKNVHAMFSDCHVKQEIVEDQPFNFAFQPFDIEHLIKEHNASLTNPTTTNEGIIQPLKLPRAPKTRRRPLANVLTSQGKQIIRNVYNYVLAENQQVPDNERVNVLHQVARFTGVSTSCLSRICCNANIQDDKVEKDDVKGKSKGSDKSTAGDQYDINAVRATMEALLSENPFVSMRTLYLHLKREGKYVSNQTSLWRVVKKLGYSYYKKGPHTFITYDNNKQALARNEYLTKIQKCREEGRKVFYQGDTFWCRAGHSCPKNILRNPTARTKQKIADGMEASDSESDDTQTREEEKKKKQSQRLIISHIGSESGFVHEAMEVFTSKSGDDKELTGESFERWIKRKVMPYIPSGSVVVIDKAAVHSRQANRAPMSSSKKDEVIEWLTDADIEFDEDLTKAELYTKYVAPNKHKCVKYVVDEMFLERGVTVVRLPPYHAELNAIEHIWKQIRANVAERNISCKLDDIAKLVVEEVANVTSEDWKTAISKVEISERKYLIPDLYMEIDGVECVETSKALSNASN